MGAEHLLERWSRMSEKERAEMRGRARLCFEARFEMNAAGNTFIAALRMLGLHA
jgi:hypothetical protein